MYAMVSGDEGAPSDPSARTNSKMDKKKVILIIVAVIVVLLVISVILGITLSASSQEPSGPTVTSGPLIEPDKYTGLKKVPLGDICYDSSNRSSYEPYINELDNFIKRYQNVSSRGKVNCHKQDRKEDEICYIDSTDIYSCGNGGWKYDEGHPCVILYFSDDSSYDPIPYETIEEFPDDVPQEVKEMALRESGGGGSFSTNLVRLHCTNVSSYDYHPEGFYKFFFPNLNIDGYLPPIAAVQFVFYDDDDNVVPGEYAVECSLWSKDPAVQEVKKVSFNIRQSKNCPN